MFSGVILILVIIFLLVLSVRERVRRQMYREKNLSESKPSPLSQALTNLVGVAGGIYLSLEVISSFVELTIPERLQLGGISMEPIAAVSILMALVQPYFQRIIDDWRKI